MSGGVECPILTQYENANSGTEYSYKIHGLNYHFHLVLNESGAALSLFIILPREGSIDNGNFGTDDGINGIFSQ